MTVTADEEFVSDDLAIANLLELERLSAEVGVLRDCAASLAKERDRTISAADSRHAEKTPVTRLRSPAL
jgi:hypothetical protein